MDISHVKLLCVAEWVLLDDGLVCCFCKVFHFGELLHEEGSNGDEYAQWEDEAEPALDLWFAADAEPDILAKDVERFQVGI